MRSVFLTCFLIFFISSIAIADKADVLEVKIEKTNDGYLNVYATVQHDDEGFEHYADYWEILDMEGNFLDKRVLRHPHTKDPFTRSILRARIPKDINKVQIRAHDNVHGFGGEIIEATVPEV